MKLAYVVARKVVVPVYREAPHMTMRVAAILLCLWTVPALAVQGWGGIGGSLSR